MTNKPTMADVWDELTLEHKQHLSMACGVDLGVLALTKISTVLQRTSSTFENSIFYDGVTIHGESIIRNCTIDGNITINGPSNISGCQITSSGGNPAVQIYSPENPEDK